MIEPHDRFAAWLADGAASDPPRDLALHAAGCVPCLAMAGALDALSTVDLDEVTLPPMITVRTSSSSPLVRAARWSTAMAALGLIALIVTFVGGGWPTNREQGVADSAAVVPPDGIEGVLGDAAGPTSTASPASSHASPTTELTPTPRPTPIDRRPAAPAGGPTQPASSVTQVPTIAPTPAPRPPRPSSSPTPSPPPSSSATPAPPSTPTPSPPATPAPTPEPTATPTATPEPTER